jgi:DNA invertase Pin-like site-specific DNA recombinase
MINHPRVLGVVRLSVETDETTSPERQREHVQHWTDGPNIMGTVIGWAEDLDVSGGMNPFKRPQLGPWLTKRADEFDVIAVWKLDRLTRRSRHFAELLDWCEENGKIIVSTSEGFDLSTPMGKMFATIIAAFAQGEWDTIRARSMDASRKLREKGAWFGGVLPFGYQFADREGGGKKLVQDPEYAALLRRLYRQIMDGATTYRLVQELNANEVPTWRDHLRVLAGRESRNRPWHPKAIRAALCNPRTMGVLLHNGEIVEDDEGEPVYITDEPILTREEWAEVTAVLTVRVGGPRAPQADTLLSGVARCGVDGGAINSKNNNVKRPDGKVDHYHNYQCQYGYTGRQDQCRFVHRQDAVDSVVETALLGFMGPLPVMVRASSTVNAQRTDLASVEARVARLEADFIAGKYDSDAAQETYFRTLNALASKLTKLRDDVATAEQQPEYVPTGQTYAQLWAAKTKAQRRSFLIDNGVEVHVWKQLPGRSAFSAKVNLGDLTQVAKAAGVNLGAGFDGIKSLVLDYNLPEEMTGFTWAELQDDSRTRPPEIPIS